MLRGEPSWHTSSTGPTSMPSSSDAVATTARSSPARRRASTRRRRSIERLPWWAWTQSSPRRSASRCATRSAIRRVLTKTSVVRCCSMSSASARRPRRADRWVMTAPSSSSGADGDVRAGRRVADVDDGGSAAHRRPGRSRDRRRRGAGRWSQSGAGSLRDRCASNVQALRPPPGALVDTGRSKRSRVRVRCEPACPGARASISSTMTVADASQASSGPARVSKEVERLGRRDDDLGASASASPSVRTEGVSPLRTATRTVGGSKPSSTAIAEISRNGVRGSRARRPSGPASGETYTTDVARRLASGAGGRPVTTVDRDEEPRQVLPEPVGAAIKGVDAGGDRSPSPLPAPGSDPPDSAGGTTPPQPGGNPRQRPVLAPVHTGPPQCLHRRGYYPNTCSNVTGRCKP